MGVIVEIRHNKIPKLVGEARERAARAVMEAAYHGETQAKDVVPVDTGYLKNSIQARRESDFAWHFGSWNVEYNAYVEFGTRRMRAQPYMRPAAEAVRPWFMQRMRDITGNTA